MYNEMVADTLEWLENMSDEEYMAWLNRINNVEVDKEELPF